jgi:hypothetical protein
MLALLIAAAAVQQQPAKCAVDTAAMLKLTTHDFDQTERGWRTLADRGCNLEAAELIAAYRQAKWSKLNSNDVAFSYWHEGQSRAMAGRNTEAIPFLLAGVNPTADPAGSPIALAFSENALATVAFLQNDLAGLKAARARLAAIPEPAMFAEMKRNSPPELRAVLKWPMNLDKVDGLIACFGKPYAIAYGCDAKEQPRR